jgi:hypothetical protein
MENLVLRAGKEFIGSDEIRNIKSKISNNIK